MTNFGLSVVAARRLDPIEFGAVALAFTVYLVLLGLSRSFCTEPLVIRFSAAAPEVQRRASAAAAGAAWAIGVILGACVVTVGFLVPGPAGRSLVALGCFAPALLLQDAWRFAFFTSGKTKSAAGNDFVWALAQFAIVAGLMSLGTFSGTWVVIAWGAGAAVAGAWGIVQAGYFPRWPSALSWWRQHGDLGWRYAGEFLAMSSATQLTVLVLTATVGLAAVGALRGAQVALGPLNILFMGMNFAALPEAVRTRQRSEVAFRRGLRLLSFGLAATAGVWGLVASVVPDSIGRQLLGASWSDSRSVLPFLALAMCASGASAGAMVGLKVLGAAGRTLAVRIAIVPFTIALGVGGALLGGATGAALGMAMATTLGAILWWRSFTHAVRENSGSKKAADLEPLVAAAAG